MGETIEATRPIPRAHGHRIIICSNSQSKPHGRVLEPKRRTKDFVSWILSSSLSCSFETTHWNKVFFIYFYLNRKPAHEDSDSRQCCQLVRRLETMTSRPESIDFLLYSTFSALMSPTEQRAVHFSKNRTLFPLCSLIVRWHSDVFRFLKRIVGQRQPQKLNSQQTALNKEHAKKKEFEDLFHYVNITTTMSSIYCGDKKIYNSIHSFNFQNSRREKYQRSRTLV